MKTLIFLCAAMLTMAADSKTEWLTDKAHTRLGFSVTHLMISEVTGEFKNYEVRVNGNKDDFSDARINIKIDVKSIDTDNDERDNVLRSKEFFNVTSHPYITFEGTSLRWITDTRLKLVGVLTINGISKTEVFEVKYGGSVNDPVDGTTKVGFKVIGKINRLDYNLKWNVPKMADSYAVGEEVEITCNLRLNKPSERQAKS